MCCRRSGPRRQPLVITLGMFAYNKYKERKDVQQQRQQIPRSSSGKSGQMQCHSCPPPEVLEREANGEIMEKIAIAPPSYDYAVHGYKDKAGDPLPISSADDDHLSDADSILELNCKGERQLSDEVSEAQAGFVRDWRQTRGVQEDEERPQLTKCQQKRADRMARKAEKAARKAGRGGMAL